VAIPKKITQVVKEYNLSFTLQKRNCPLKTVSKRIKRG